jgi:hypothetical protein
MYFLYRRDQDDLLKTQYWLDRLRSSGRYLENVKTELVVSFYEPLIRFADYYDGVVLWDPEVPATSNLASTIAGVENLLPVPYRTEENSVYNQIVTAGLRLPVVINLVGKFTGSGTIPDISQPSSGSAKNDAYRWAVDRYLMTGRTNPNQMAYYVDYSWANLVSGPYQWNTLTNHDYFVGERAFFWDLSPWGDEKPLDDPDQPTGTDLNTLKIILAAQADKVEPGRFIHTGGYPPFKF